MNHDLFTWDNLQTVIIGTALGFVRALSTPTPSFLQFVCVMLTAGFAGGAAALVFGPMMSVGVTWVFGDKISREAVWMFSSGFMGATGITCITYVNMIGAALVEWLKKKIGDTQ